MAELLGLSGHELVFNPESVLVKVFFGGHTDQHLLFSCWIAEIVVLAWMQAGFGTPLDSGRNPRMKAIRKW